MAMSLSSLERHALVTRRNPDGSTEGLRPDEVSRETWERIGHAAEPVLAVIRAKCLDCCGGSPSEVARCTAADCRLLPYRMGSNPLRERVALSDDERRRRSDRMRALHARS